MTHHPAQPSAPATPRPAPSAAPRRAALLAGALAAGLALAGCAALQPQTPEQIVEQRVEARWNALMKGDFEQAWTFTQPGFRALVKQQDYRKRFGTAGQWRGVQVHGVECAAERCSVRLRLTSRFMTPPFHRQDVVGTIDETWVREDRQWWFYQAL